MSIRSRKYELIITEPAEIDLESISAYSYLEFGEERAIKYTTDIFNTISLINKDPSIGKKRYGLPGVILGRKSGRHVIFYRVQDNTIYIIRILHETMDHGRHIN